MRRQTLVIAAAAALCAAQAHAAPPKTEPPPAAPSPPPVPPRLFVQAGYAEPAVPAGSCQVVSPRETRCVLPAMTAGRYFVAASGVSTATADGAEQQIILVAGDQRCTSTRAPDPKTPWTVGAKRTFVAGCLFTIITDTPLPITAVYLDAKATKDPAGPKLEVSPQAWTGALSATAVTIKQ